MRTEQKILKNLKTLCQTPGYIYVIYNLILKYASDIKKNTTRKEIDVLIGFMIKAPLETFTKQPELINPEFLESIHQNLEKTEQLLSKLHKFLSDSMESIKLLHPTAIESNTQEPQKYNNHLKFQLLYSQDLAFINQYINLAKERYEGCADWLQSNKGFTIEQCVSFAQAINSLYINKYNSHSDHFLSFYSRLLFVYNLKDTAKEAKLDIGIVNKIVTAFALDKFPCNNEFTGIGTQNLTIAKPIIRLPGDEFIVINQDTLLEAIYEQPFLWMKQDKQIKANEIKGKTLENSVEKRIKKVFGQANVYKNVEIHCPTKPKGQRTSEIDILVIYHQYVILIETKSKGISREAREGNLLSFDNDFKNSIQKAYEQSWKAAEHILDEACKLVVDGKNLNLPQNLNKIFIAQIFSSNYPALYFFSSPFCGFIQYKENSKISNPITTDIFCLDIIIDLLPSPIYLLDFMDKYSLYYKHIITEDILNVFADYLKTGMKYDLNERKKILYSYDNDLDLIIRARHGELKGKKDIEIEFLDNDTKDLINHLEKSNQKEAQELGLLLIKNHKIIKTIAKHIMVALDQANIQKASIQTSSKLGWAIFCCYSNSYDEQVLDSVKDNLKRLSQNYQLKTCYGIIVCSFSTNKFEKIIKLDKDNNA